MTPIIIALAIAGLVWGTLFVLRGSMVAGALIYLLLACCFGLYFLRIDIGSTLSLDRLWLVFLLGVYAVQRRLGMVDPKPWTKVDTVLALFVGLLTASMFYQRAQGNGLETTDTPIFMHLVNGYLFPLALYWITRQAPASERTTNWVLGCFTLFGVYLAVTGIAEYLGAWWMVFPKYIASEKLGLHFGRARGPMLTSVTYGLYVGVAWMASWLWMLRMGKWGRVAILSLTPLFVAALLCDLTRSTWLGAGLAGMAVMAIELPKRWRPVVLGGVAAVGLLVSVAKSDKILSLDRGDNSASQTLESAQLRKSFIYVSWQMFQDRPILGFGFGQFTKDKLPYLGDRQTSLRLEPIRDWIHHNTFLSLLTETGAVGFVLYCLLLLGWAWRGQSWARTESFSPGQRHLGTLLLATVATYAVQAFSHEVSFSPLENGILFCVAGLATSAAYSRPSGQRMERRAATYQAVPQFAPPEQQPGLGELEAVR